MLQFVKYDNSIFFINRYKDHILYGCQGNKYDKKNAILIPGAYVTNAKRLLTKSF